MANSEKYEKRILSDLQGAWSCLRDVVVNFAEGELRNQLLFEIGEATSWENVKELSYMYKIVEKIRKRITEETANSEIQFWIESIDNLMKEARCADRKK